MFSNASSFNRDLSDWDVSNIAGGVVGEDYTNMDGMFDNSGLSTDNYDELLNGWSQQNVQSNVSLGAQGINYCNGADARQSLIDNHNWTITDAGLDCPTQVVANQPNNIVICDDNNDGYGTFDIEMNTPEILNAQDASQFQVSYHTSLADAESNSEPIFSPYEMLVSEVQTIYARVTDIATGDYDTTNFEIIVITCQDDGDDNDGVGDSDEDLNNNGNLNDDDTDSDGIPNYLDDDDDNDEILTINEDYNLNGDPTDDDTDNSGVADYLEANVALNINSSYLNLLKVFPNPTDSYLFIEGINNPIYLSIYNLLGKKVMYKSNIEKIDVSELSKGVYIINISDGVSQIIRKFIKN